MYASVTEVRDEGVTITEASDARLRVLIDEATALIDRVTGWCFEPRPMTLYLSGRGSATLELPVPPIRIVQLSVNGDEWPLGPESLLVVGAPIHPGFDGSRIILRYGRVFPKGQANVTLSGTFGFTEDDGSFEGRTPPAIRRACIMLVLRNLAPLASDAATDARSRWRIIEERTRDQSYRVSPIDGAAASLTGDPEIDALLIPYMRPPPLGAA